MATYDRTTTARLRLRDGAVQWREVDGQVVAIDHGAREYLAVNHSGTVLWPALVAGATAAELAQLLVDRYEIDADTAASDVDALVADLERRRLLDR